MRTKILAVAAFAVAGAAFADDPSKTGGVPGVDVDVNANANLSMPMADKNSDGKISKAEAASNKELSAQFDKLDSNKDGNLDKGEFAKFEAKGSAKGKAGDASKPSTTDDTAPTPTK